MGCSCFKCWPTSTPIADRLTWMFAFVRKAGRVRFRVGSTMRNSSTSVPMTRSYPCSNSNAARDDRKSLL